MPSDYWNKANALQEKYLRKLQTHDIETLNLITKKYGSLFTRLLDVVDVLAKTTNKTPAQIIKLKIYQDFLKDLKKETIRFNNYAENVIAVKQEIFIQFGLSYSQDAIGLLGVGFQKLNPKALSWMVGNSIEGGRLYTLLEKSYPQTVKKITDTLIESVAIGRNPKVTARYIKAEMDGNLSRALRISRTETIQAYRESSRLQMIESGLVEKWEWDAELDACEFCSGQNGKQFSLDTVFETHPNCRCVPLPIID